MINVLLVEVLLKIFLFIRWFIYSLSLLVYLVKNDLIYVFLLNEFLI